MPWSPHPGEDDSDVRVLHSALNSQQGHPPVAQVLTRMLHSDPLLVAFASLNHFQAPVRVFPEILPK